MLLFGGNRAGLVSSPEPGFCVLPNASVTDRWLNPFSSAAASRIPIGTGAIYATADDQTTLDLRMHGWNSVGINSTNLSGHKEAYGSKADPVRTVVVSGSGGNATIHIPNSFVVPANTGDSALTIYDEEDGRFHQFFGYHGGGGDPFKAQIHKNIDPSGNAFNVSTSASKYHQLAVNFRTHEWTGTDPITHCLNLSLLGRKQSFLIYGAGSRCQLATTSRWPANGVDGFVTNPAYASVIPGAIQYGSRFAIPPHPIGPDPALLNLGVVGGTKWKVYWALVYYGALVMDASDNPTARADQNLGATLVASIRSAYSSFYQHLRLVTNTTSAQLVAQGGGAPLAPNCAYNSGAPRT